MSMFAKPNSGAGSGLTAEQLAALVDDTELNAAVQQLQTLLASNASSVELASAVNALTTAVSQRASVEDVYDALESILSLLNPLILSRASSTELSAAVAGLTAAVQAIPAPADLSGLTGALSTLQSSVDNKATTQTVLSAKTDILSAVHEIKQNVPAAYVGEAKRFLASRIPAGWKTDPFFTGANQGAAASDFSSNAASFSLYNTLYAPHLTYHSTQDGYVVRGEFFYESSQFLYECAADNSSGTLAYIDGADSGATFLSSTVFEQLRLAAAGAHGLTSATLDTPYPLAIERIAGTLRIYFYVSLLTENGYFNAIVYAQINASEQFTVVQTKPVGIEFCSRFNRTEFLTQVSEVKVLTDYQSWSFKVASDGTLSSMSISVLPDTIEPFELHVLNDKAYYTKSPSYSVLYCTAITVQQEADSSLTLVASAQSTKVRTFDGIVSLSKRGHSLVICDTSSIYELDSQQPDNTVKLAHLPHPTFRAATFYRPGYLTKTGDFDVLVGFTYALTPAGNYAANQIAVCYDYDEAKASCIVECVYLPDGE